MKRALIVLLLTVASTAAAQIHPTEQNGTVWFYYPAEAPSPLGIPNVLHVGGITRVLAKLAPGEFFGYPVSPGVHVFSYTRAPSRDEFLTIAIKPGEEAYVEVHFRQFASVSVEEGKRAIQRSRPISDLSVLDSSIVLVGLPPARRTPSLIASLNVSDTRTARQTPTPTAVLPPPSTPPRTLVLPPSASLTPGPSSQGGTASRTLILPPQAPGPVSVASAVPESGPVPPLSVSRPQTETAPTSQAPLPVVAAIPVSARPQTDLGPRPAQPPASAAPSPATQPQKTVTAAAVATTNPARDSAPRKVVESSEAFLKATLNIQLDGRKREIDAVVTFDKDVLVVTERKNRGVLKLFPYTAIKSAEYSYSKSPQWKTTAPINLSFLTTSTSAMKHWLLVLSNDDYAVVELDKANYNLVLAAFELRTGRKVEIVKDNK